MKKLEKIEDFLKQDFSQPSMGYGESSDNQFNILLSNLRKSTQAIIESAQGVLDSCEIGNPEVKEGLKQAIERGRRLIENESQD